MENKKIGIEIGHWYNPKERPLVEGMRETVLNLEVGREINRQLKRHDFSTILNGVLYEGDMSMEEFFNDKKDNYENEYPANLGGTKITKLYNELNSMSSDDLVAGIAVHFNGAGKGELQTTAQGFIAFTQSNHYQSESQNLCWSIANELGEIGHVMHPLTVNSSAGQDWNDNVNKVPAPFAYCEFGFYDNPNEREKFDTPEKQRAFGKAAAKGIVNYLQSVGVGDGWREETVILPNAVCGDCGKCPECQCTCNCSCENLCGNCGKCVRCGGLAQEFKIELSHGNYAVSLEEPMSLYTGLNGKLSSLPVLEQDGYDFLGWFSDDDLTEEVTADTVFTSNSRIYAGWRKESNQLYTLINDSQIMIGKYAFNKYEFGTPITRDDVVKEAGKYMWIVPFFIYKGDLYFEYNGYSSVTNNNSNYFGSSGRKFGYSHYTNPQSNVFATYFYSTSSISANHSVFYVEYIINKDNNHFTTVTERKQQYSTSNIVTNIYDNDSEAYANRRWANISQLLKNKKNGINSYPTPTLAELTANDSPEFISDNLHNFTSSQGGAGAFIVPSNFVDSVGQEFFSYIFTLEPNV